MPTLDEYRNNTGEFAEQSAEEQDAAVQTEETEVEDAEETEQEETPVDGLEESETEEEPELSPKEKTAFVKRLEAEKKKIAEQLRAELKSEYTAHEEVVRTLGGDPAKILEKIRRNEENARIQSQADALAQQYGWSDQEHQQFIQNEVNRADQEQQQRQTQRELQELRIQNEINKLAKRPEYNGIDALEQEIIAKVNQSNGSLTAGEAFLALGGEKRMQQIKRETEQRMVAERSKKRTVLKDSSAVPSGEKPLSPDILQQAKKLGLTEKEARELMDFDASNVSEYRKKKK